MTYCKAKGEILDIIKKDSRNPECYSDIYVKVKKGESFIIAKGTLKNTVSNNCTSDYKPNFKSNLDLPKVGDDINYLLYDYIVSNFSR